MSDETKNEAVQESTPVEQTTAEPVTEPAAKEPAAEPIAESLVELQTESPAVTEEAPKPTKLINFTELKAGQTIRIHERIKDVNAKGEERERIQVFEGIILGLRGSRISRTMTVRKVSGGVGVEKIYPVNSPIIVKIELVKTARVRRAKLSFVTNTKSRFRRKLKETYVSK